MDGEAIIRVTDVDAGYDGVAILEHLNAGMRKVRSLDKADQQDLRLENGNI